MDRRGRLSSSHRLPRGGYDEAHGELGPEAAAACRQVRGDLLDDDVPGFGLRLREGGSRSFVFQYKLGAKQRRIALGPVSATDFSKVRETAKDLYARVRLGQDPAGEKDQAKAKATNTFLVIAELFLEHQKGVVRPKQLADATRHIRVYAKPLHELQFEKITRRDIASCIHRRPQEDRRPNDGEPV